MAKWHVLKWSGEDIVEFLNIAYTETLKLFGVLAMKTMKTKYAREHNIHKVKQELTTTGLHIDNEESLKKNY